MCQMDGVYHRCRRNKHPYNYPFNQPEAEMKTVVRRHLQRLITGSDNVRTEGGNEIRVQVLLSDG